MPDQLIEIQSDHTNRQTAVILPCGPEQFSQFISGLLGRPQELVGVRSGRFRIDREGALQLNALIVQRVFQQHGVHPLQFTARVAFDNGTSVLLNSIEDFTNFHEVRPVCSVGLTLTWSFLIHFQGAHTPEKQDIEVSFHGERRFIVTDSTPILRTGGASYRIKHTARTWGADIEGLLANYLDDLMAKEGVVRTFVRENSGIIGIITAVVVLSTFVTGLVWTSSEVVESHSAALNKILGAAVSANAKLDGIATFLQENARRSDEIHKILYLLLGIVLSVVAGLVAGVTASRTPVGDVVFTRKAEKNFEEHQRNYKRSNVTVVLSVVGAIAIAIASNIAYDFFVKRAIEKQLKSAAIQVEGHVHSALTRLPLTMMTQQQHSVLEWRVSEVSEC
jgi:hypothetical protein